MRTMEDVSEFRLPRSGWERKNHRGSQCPRAQTQPPGCKSRPCHLQAVSLGARVPDPVSSRVLLCMRGLVTERTLGEGACRGVDERPCVKCCVFPATSLVLF